ncbi:toll/interleukin-1 receptor domain-containing protein [Cytobacillus firmus]|uniref:toll/interleukin-1 receptor domain-containing protein n=1 Tax=Cytobacillus firmus TaxID=1399 RepID=UPI003BA07A90
MALFSRRDLINKANSVIQKSYYAKSASTILIESYKAYSPLKTYDIFLSHSYQDAEVILGLKNTLEERGYEVYVDWIEDKQLSRGNVNAQTANQIRNRMRTCRSLFFATSDNSSDSKWMPWELGYYDGFRGKVAILPINNSSYQKDSFEGQEYLGLYNYVIDNHGFLYIKYLTGSIKSFREWVSE